MGNDNPRLVLNFLAILVIISCFLIVLKDYGRINESYYNLSADDLKWRIGNAAIHLIFMLGIIGVFYKKSWGWIFITTVFIEYLLILMRLNFSVENFSILPRIIFLAILISITVYLYLPSVRRFLNVGVKSLAFPIIINILLIGFNRIKFDHESGNINYFYLVDKDLKYHFENSLYTGKTFYFHNNGQKDFEGFIKNGMFDGEFKYFNRSGQLSYIVSYKRNEMSGKYKEWYEYPNDIKTEGQYIKGLKDGVWKTYGKDSGFTEIETYRLDTLISTEYIEEKM